MKVIVFAPYVAVSPHGETDLEIIQRHLDAGDEVIHLHCNGTMMTCDFNQKHKFSGCCRCIQSQKNGLKLLSKPIPSISFLNLTPTNRQELAVLQKKFTSMNELKELKVENFDIGWAVLSSIISRIRDPYPDTTTALSSFIARFVVTAYSVYRSIQNHLDKFPVDRVYVFNGRFAPCRAVLRACQSRNTPCFLHERGHDLKHFALFENNMPHEVDYFEKEIRQEWDRGNENPQREELGAKFYTDRAKGIVHSGISFTKGQKAKLLPPNWDAAQTNIVIFNSSEDEFAAIGDSYQNPIYTNQFEGLEKIIQSLQDYQDKIHIYLRIHPNLLNVDNADVRALQKLRAKHLTLIALGDPDSTYALICHADKVLTFGSTVGIEAVYWGKPSILAGQSLYRNLGATYNPRTHEELICMAVRNLEPKDKTGALMYGYFYNTFGIPYKYYTPTGLCEGLFKGVPIKPKPTVWNQVVFRIRTFLPYRWFFMLITRVRVMRNFRLSKTLRWFLGGGSFGEF